MPRSKPSNGEAPAAPLHTNETKFIELHEQTQHKLEVMRRYDGAYLGIIAQAGKNGVIDADRVFLIDVCSGAGSHLSLENPRSQVPGTAVQACIESREIQRRFPDTHVSVRLIDIEPDVCARLGVRVAEFVEPTLNHPERVDVRVIDQDFASQIAPLLAETRKPDGSLYCSLWFIDPFGTKAIPKSALRPLFNKRGIELVINLDVSGIRRIRKAINSPNTPANIREADRKLLDALFGDRRWDVAVPENMLLEDECKAIAETYASSFVGQSQYREIYPLKVSDSQVRYLVHLTQVPKARNAFASAYNATIPKAKPSKALSMTDRDKRVERLFLKFRGERVPFEDMVALPDCPLDRNQLRTVLRRAQDTGHGLFDETRKEMQWNMDCMKPPALPLDFNQHTEKRHAKKINSMLGQPGLFDVLPFPK